MAAQGGQVAELSPAQVRQDCLRTASRFLNRHTHHTLPLALINNNNNNTTQHYYTTAIADFIFISFPILFSLTTSPPPHHFTSSPPLSLALELIFFLSCPLSRPPSPLPPPNPIQCTHTHTMTLFLLHSLHSLNNVELPCVCLCVCVFESLYLLLSSVHFPVAFLLLLCCLCEFALFLFTFCVTSLIEDYSHYYYNYYFFFSTESPLSDSPESVCSSRQAKH